MKKSKHTDTVLEVAKVFFKLGCISFGGPAAHVAMMEEEVVTKRKWLDRQRFLDLMGATNLIPGPNSTELTMHCGYERAGIAGLFAAGISFIFPAVVITLLLAYLYVRFGQLPALEAYLYGIKPAVLAIIAAAVFKLGKKALKNWELAVVGLVVISASFMGVNEIIALLAAGVIGASFFYFRDKQELDKASFLPFMVLQSPNLSVESWKVFFTFLKVGAVLYGSGYVLFAYLDAELVGQGWLSRSELMDAIAVGQFTPGPVLSTATFIGYQLAGWQGALGATIGIFLPSFLFVWLLNPLVARMRKSLWLSYFLDCVNVAAVAVMLAVLLVMSMDTLLEWRAILIAILSFVYTFGVKKSNALLTIVGGVVLGSLLSWI